MTNLANFEPVDPREIWPNEAADFTPWLAENLSLLGKVLKLDLELRGTEVRVGSYLLDILAHDKRADRSVVIENQLEPTDHDHLGKLLTYAAGHDAGTIVWIAGEFRDEHRVALDYLNARTMGDTEFFGVVVGLWKIDDSRPAVKFDLVVDPNESPKERVGKHEDGKTPEIKEKYGTFFQSLVDTLREKHPGFTGATEGGDKNLKTFSATPSLSGRVSYRVVFESSGQVMVNIYIERKVRGEWNNNKEWNEQLFDKLMERKGDIDSKLGSLFWDRMDNLMACRIAVYRSGTIYDDQETLKEIREWVVERLLAFNRVFRPILEELAPIMDELAE